MYEQPDKEALLSAIATFLMNELRPVIRDPRLAFRVLIAANLQAAYGRTYHGSSPLLESMMHIIEAGDAALDTIGQLLKVPPPSVCFDRNEVRLLAPVPVPPQMRDFLCFELHVRQSRANRYLFGIGTERVDPAKVEIAKVWYERPIFYKGNTFSVVGHDAEVLDELRREGVYD